jgi:hypothetical protein
MQRDQLRKREIPERFDRLVVHRQTPAVRAMVPPFPAPARFPAARGAGEDMIPISYARLRRCA